MYFKDQKCILIRVPKTGGNSIQFALHKYSSDKIFIKMD